MKTVFVNPERCIGCRQCEFACAVAHSQSRDAVAALFEDPSPRSRIHVAPGATLHSSFPGKCRHCDPAPCQQVCPSGAISRDDQFDLVLVDPRKCISCAMCAMVCPFDVLTFHTVVNGQPAHIAALKCDGCIDRLGDGLEPACTAACKTSALVYGELNELVEEARIREAMAVLSAAQAVRPVAQTAPTYVTAWRNWGRSANETLED